MKKIYLILTVLSIVAVSCSKSDVKETNEISFAPTINTPTKVSGGSFEIGDVIGLFATQYEDNVSPQLQLGGNYASNIPVTFDGHNWTSTPTLYWGDGKMDFYAYYPKTEVKSIEEYPFSVALDQREASSDFLWTKSIGLTRTSSVPLVFKHLLSKVVVKLQKGEDYEGDLPANATLLIHNTIPDALIDLSTGDVIKAPRSVSHTITAVQESDGVYSAILIPQMLTNRVPLFELVCKDVSYLVESKFNFKSGVCHTVNFTLSDNPERVLITIGGEIQGWN